MTPAPPRRGPSWVGGSSRHIATYLVLAALPLAGCTCTDLAGPEAQLTQAARELAGLKALPGTDLQIQRLGITRITAEPELQPPRVVFSFDLDGTLRLDGGAVQVSAIGVERTPMAYRAGRYQPSSEPLPHLAQSLRELERESPPSRRWLLRVDVEKVQVTEEMQDGTRKSVELP